MTLLEQIEKQLNELPPDKQNEVLDFAVFLKEREIRLQTNFDEPARKKRIKQAFERLAEMKTFAHIEDPIEWQRKIRKDRPLPGRG